MREIKAILANLRSGTLIESGEDGFAARFPYRNEVFGIIFSWGGGWEHLSISGGRRCPFWGEMCMFKEIFFRDDEMVMQLHPAKTDYVNVHEFCLHLWRPIEEKIPEPPKIFV